LNDRAARAYIPPAMKSGNIFAAAMVILGVSTTVAVTGCNRLKDPSGTAGTAPKRDKAPDKAQTAPAALQKNDVKVGDGPAATKGKIVHIRYTGYLPDGTRFDSNLDRPPLQFQLGQGSVLRGWDLGIEGMKVGGKRKLIVPPALAFGSREVGQIKANSTLTFDVELVAVQ
jgi:FKBP-type peptidyl-prolyl cis-trans isomerase